MHTTPHTPISLAFRFAVAALLLAASGLASAQIREFPANALRGKLQVLQPPDILLDGKADRLAPGARIRNITNNFTVSGALVGQTLAVNYVREPSTGLVFDVWVLTADEIALPRPNTPKRRWFEFF
ncbi:hypothetical protein [Variovorax sp. HJSM1_2]|uniref:hypothetical protein n=1 Tax=Variovorax sp. HJSM1_2 TaxID=3366263 RepID=UPI003BEC6162